MIWLQASLGLICDLFTRLQAENQHRPSSKPNQHWQSTGKEDNETGSHRQSPTTGSGGLVLKTAPTLGLSQSQLPLPATGMCPLLPQGESRCYVTPKPLQPHPHPSQRCANIIRRHCMSG